jgi:IS1 family transposase
MLDTSSRRLCYLAVVRQALAIRLHQAHKGGAQRAERHNPDFRMRLKRPHRRTIHFSKRSLIFESHHVSRQFHALPASTDYPF